jgi:hypothetical protein
MAEYDLDKNGFLDEMELERCPGLKSMLESYDRDKDGRLSRAEIEEALKVHVQSKLGLLEVRCKVTLDKEPLAGATVIFEPEVFMGLSIKPAKGITNERGVARLDSEGAPKPGCRPGIYRVRISKIDESGKEIVPAQYQSQTPLGAEVGPAMRGLFSFRLSSS